MKPIKFTYQPVLPVLPATGRVGFRNIVAGSQIFDALFNATGNRTWTQGNNITHPGYWNGNIYVLGTGMSQRDMMQDRIPFLVVYPNGTPFLKYAYPSQRGADGMMVVQM